MKGIDFYFQSKVLAKYSVYSQLVALCVTTVLCFLFVYWEKPLIYFVSVVLIEACITSIGLLTLYNFGKDKISSWRVDFKIIKRLLKDSWPLMMVGFAVSIYMRIDQIMIKELVGIDAVGIYSSAVRISEASYFIPISITAAVFPAIINAKMEGEKVYYDRLKHLFSFLFFLGILFTALLFTFSHVLINFLYGSEFLPAVGVLMIHVWAGVFIYLGVAIHKWFINENLQIYQMVYTLIGAATNIALNFALIPRFGIQGAAFTTVISQFIAVILVNFCSRKTRKILFVLFQSMNLVQFYSRIVTKQSKV